MTQRCFTSCKQQRRENASTVLLPHAPISPVLSREEWGQLAAQHYLEQPQPVKKHPFHSCYETAVLCSCSEGKRHRATRDSHTEKLQLQHALVSERDPGIAQTDPRHISSTVFRLAKRDTSLLLMLIMCHLAGGGGLRSRRKESRHETSETRKRHGLDVCFFFLFSR